MEALREYVRSLEQKVARLQSTIARLGAGTEAGEGGERR
jgi:hypothetical protein